MGAHRWSSLVVLVSLGSAAVAGAQNIGQQGREDMMRRTSFLFALMVLVAAGLAAAQGGSVDGDRAALVALYDSTNGDNWRRNGAWKTTAPLGEWYGVLTGDAGRVIALDLFDNDLSGPIPPELGGLTRLFELYLTDNDLSGPIPPELGRLTRLSQLFLAGNDLSGPIPPELSGLTGLSTLVLAENGLSGPIPPELGAMTRLQDLLLSNNDLSGPIPTELINLFNLYTLFLSPGNEGLCAPSDAAFVAWLESLEQLEWTGPTCAAVPVQESDREVLEAFYHATDGPNWRTSTNWLSDAPLSEWHGVSANDEGLVEALTLLDNQLSGPIPSQLGQLTNLARLTLSENQLSGPIPPELGQLTNLARLTLSVNQLSGPIPPELGGLTNLDTLHLIYNQLSGPIPPELGGLTNLGNLQLYDNQLSGPIPPELGGLTNLRFLILHTNQLSGPIPPELGRLTDLSILHLNYNQLSGPIPPELGRLTNLSSLNLSLNQLSGPIPVELGNLTALRSLGLDSDTGLCLPPSLQETAFGQAAVRLGVPLCAPLLSPKPPVVVQQACERCRRGGDERGGSAHRGRPGDGAAGCVVHIPLVVGRAGRDVRGADVLGVVHGARCGLGVDDGRRSGRDVDAGRRRGNGNRHCRRTA